MFLGKIARSTDPKLKPAIKFPLTAPDEGRLIMMATEHDTGG